MSRPGRPQLQVLVAVVISLVVLVVLLLAVLADAEPRRAGTNGRLLAQPATVPPGKRFCQAAEVLPKGTAALAVNANTLDAPRPGGPLEATVRLPGGRTLHARAAGGFGTQVVTIVLDEAPLTTDVYGVTVCVRNRGRIPLAFYGDRVQPGESGATVVGGVPEAPTRVRLDYLRTGQERWLALAPVVAERFGRMKASFFGTWTFAFAMALAGSLALATALFLVRTLRT